MKAVGNVGGALMAAAPFTGPAAGGVAAVGAGLWAVSTIYANRKQIGQGLKWTGEKIAQGWNWGKEKIGQGLKWHGEKLTQGSKAVGEGIKKTGKVIGDGLKKIGGLFK